MKIYRFATAALALLFSATTYGKNAASALPSRESACSWVYIDLSTGINNNGGLLGGGVDVHVADDISLIGGVGLMTTWGYKAYTGVKCYLKPCHMGWAFGGGLTYNTGIPAYTQPMDTQNGTKEDVTLDLLPQANVYAAAYKHWRLGRNNNRIYLQLGVTRSLMNTKFRQTAGPAITATEANIMKALSPGGIIIGLGFSFGAN